MVNQLNEGTNMKEVYTTFSEFGTWNAMYCDTGLCAFYGDIDELEQWLEENEATVSVATCPAPTVKRFRLLHNADWPHLDPSKFPLVVAGDAVGGVLWVKSDTLKAAGLDTACPCDYYFELGTEAEEILYD